MKKEEVIKSVKSGVSLKDFSEFNDDVDVVKEALKVDWKNIKFASNNLKNNHSIALLAVAQSENAMKQLSETMQKDPHVLVKAFDVSHKIAFVNPDMLNDLEYLKGVLKVGSSEHKIIEMLNDELLEKFAADIYPYLRKALEKINYAYSDGFSVRSLMYKLPFAKGIELANQTIDFDYRMNSDIDQMNSDQLYALVVLTRFSDRLDNQRLLQRIVATDCISAVEWLVKNKLINDKDMKVLTEIGIVNKSAKINAYLMLKQNKKDVDPRDDLLFHLLSEEELLREEGYKSLLNNIFDYENDEEVIMAFLKSNPPVNQIHLVLSSSGDVLRSNKEFINSIVKLDPNNMQYAQDHLKKDKAFIKKILKNGDRYNHTQLLRYIDSQLLEDEAFIDELMNIDINAIQYANPIILNNKDRVLKLLERSPSLYVVLDEKLKADPEIALLALKVNGNLFKELPVELRQDKTYFELALNKLNAAEDLLRFAGDSIQKDKQLVKLNIEKYLPALQSAPEEVKEDREFILEILQIKREKDTYRFIEFEEFEEKLRIEFDENGFFYGPFNAEKDKEQRLKDFMQKVEISNLEFVGEGLRSRLDFMEPLIHHNPFLYRFVTGELRNNSQIIEYVLTKEPFCIKYVPNTYFSSLNSSAKNYYKKFIDPNIKSASETMAFESLEDFEVVQSNDNQKLAQMIANDPYQFKTLPDDKKKDRGLLESIIELNPHAVHAMWGVSESFYLKAIEEDASVVEDLYKGMKHSEEFMLKAIKRNDEAMYYALKTMKNKKSFVLEAVNKNGMCLGYVDEKFQSDENIVLAAVRQEPKAFMYASNELLMKKDFAEIIYKTLERVEYPGLTKSRPMATIFRYVRNETPGEKPTNFGKKWTQSDLQMLIDEYKSGVEIDYIAKRIGRDILACLVKLSENKIINDETYKELEDKYDIPIELNILLKTLGKSNN